MGHESNNPLIQALTECAAACNHCASACLDQEDVEMMAECIKLDIDCAEICSLLAAFIARNSDYANDLLEPCITICNACAGECAQHKNDHCKSCAEACRKCAVECEHALQV